MDKFKKYCDKYNFIADETLTEFKSIFNNNKLKELSIDIYTNTDELLLRTYEKNVCVSLDNSSIIIYKNNNDKINIANFLLKSIDNCIVKLYNDNQFEIIISIHNLNYRLFIIK